MDDEMNRNNKKKRWIIAVVLLVLAVLVGVFYYQGTKAATPNYATGVVTRGDMVTKVNVTGTINPVHYVDVSTNVPGELESVLVKENEYVEKNQVIAYIDADKLKDTEAAAKALYDNKAAAFKRAEMLHAEGAVSTQVYDDARMAFISAKADYDRAARNVADATIVAPMSGTIVGTPLQPGQTISTGLSSQMIIATIADLRELEIYLAVDETDIAKVHPGDRVDFTVDAYTNRTFHGVVSTIAKGTRGTLGTVSKSVVFYTVKVKIDDEETADLLPTMTARALIYGPTKKDVLMVPLTAVRSDKEGSFVYLIQENEPVRHSVVTGMTGDSMVEIVSGVSENDEIVISGDVKEKAKKNGRGLSHPRFR